MSCIETKNRKQLLLCFLKFAGFYSKDAIFYAVTMKEYMIEPGKLSESNSSVIFTLELFPKDKN